MIEFEEEKKITIEKKKEAWVREFGLACLDLENPWCVGLLIQD